VFADVLVRFYTGEPGPFAGAMPIGLALSGKMAAPNAMLEAVTGNAKYVRNIVKMNDTADPLAVIRNAFSAQFDQNAIVVLTGPATNLAGLLALPGSPALIEKKVRTLVIGADAVTMSDLPAAKRVLAEWPTPIVVAGSELGDAFPFPGGSIEKDFAWSDAHPLVAAYRAYRPMPYDAPAVAMAAALYAVRPQENYFKVSEPGALTLTDDGHIRLAPAAGGKHHTLIADPAQKDRIQQIYAETASTKPVGRPQRFRPPQKKQ
jgi:hypothetical protein